MVRAVRLAATLGFDDRARHAGRDPRDARRSSPTCRASGSRRSSSKLLAADRPSIGLRLLEETGVLAAISRRPRRAARDRPEQGPGRGPLGPHAPDRRRRAARPAASSGSRRSLHDIGKPATRGRRPLLRPRGGRRRARRASSSTGSTSPRRPVRERSSTSSASTCSAYEPAWGDAAVRRFIAKIGPAAIDDLFALREADNVGSGAPADADDLDELRARIDAELAAARSWTGRRSRSTAPTSWPSWGWRPGRPRADPRSALRPGRRESGHERPPDCSWASPAT